MRRIPHTRFIHARSAVLATLVIVAASCGGEGTTESTGANVDSVTAPTTALPTTSPSPTTQATTVPTTTTAPTTTSPAVGGIGWITLDLVDTSRSTDEVPGSIEASDSRLLQTTVRYPAVADGEEVDPVADGLPLIMFSHGLGGGPSYLFATADVLVDAGYVVALPLFPESQYGAGAGDFIEQPADLSFIIDQLIEQNDGNGTLGGTIDPERIGAAGHSLGAMTTAGLVFNDCCIDDSVDAATLFAGVAAPFPDTVYAWPETPLLLIHGDQDETLPYDLSVAMSEAANGPTYFLSLLDVDHGAGLWNPGHAGLMTDALVAFFDEHVAGVDNGLDTISSTDDLSTWETFNLS